VYHSQLCQRTLAQRWLSSQQGATHLTVKIQNKEDAAHLSYGAKLIMNKTMKKE
jgi:hypothetical protein